VAVAELHEGEEVYFCFVQARRIEVTNQGLGIYIVLTTVGENGERQDRVKDRVTRASGKTLWGELPKKWGRKS
jgi:hypothetical protein